MEEMQGWNPRSREPRRGQGRNRAGTVVFLYALINANMRSYSPAPELRSLTRCFSG